MQSHFEKFCSVIYLAGLKECYHTKHAVIRWLWIFFYAAGFYMTGYFMYIVITDYNSNPTFTQVTLTLQDSFAYPEIFFVVGQHAKEFCTNANLTVKGCHYLKSLHFDQYFSLNRTLHEDGRKAVDEYVTAYNFTTLNSVYRFAFSDLKKLIYLYPCHYCLKIDLNNPIYFPDFENANIDAVKFDLVFEPYRSRAYKKLSRRNTWDTEQNQLVLRSRDDNFGNFTFWLMIGSKSLGKANRFITQLMPDSVYDIYIKPQIIKRYNKGGKTCLNNINKTEAACQDECVITAKRKCGNCTIYENGNDDLIAKDDITLCSSLLLNLTECQRNESIFISNCFDSCLPLCEETIFETTRTKKQSSLGWISITFFMTSINNGILTFREVPSYSFQSAVSNVGGQLGLWLGLSVVTAVQAILFWLDKYFDYRATSFSGIPKCGCAKYFITSRENKQSSPKEDCVI